MSKYTEHSAVRRLTRNRAKVNMEKKTITKVRLGNRLLGTTDYLINYHNYHLIY